MPLMNLASCSVILNDSHRLAAVRQTGILDSPSEDAFDRLTRLATRLLHAPIAIFSLLEKDRQFFKSAIGVPESFKAGTNLPIDESVCRYTLTGKPLAISDTREHGLYKENKNVSDLNMVSYLGVPVRLLSGEIVGALCIIDHVPRDWSEEEIGLLEDMAYTLVTELELRIKTKSELHNPEALEKLKREFIQSEGRFRAIFEQSPLSIQIFATDGSTILVNPSWHELWGVDDEFVKNFIFKEYNVFEDRLLAEKGVLPLIKRGFAGEVVEVHDIYYDPNQIGHKGQGRWVRSVVYPLKNDTGEVREVVVIHNDVTEHHNSKAERERLLSQLSFERNSLEAILRQMPAGVCVMEEKTKKIILHNQQIEQIFSDFAPGSRLEDLNSLTGFRSDGTAYGPNDWPLMRSLLHGELVNDEEMEFHHNNGSPTYLNLSSGPIRDSEGKIAAAIIICTDISEWKRTDRIQKFLASLTAILQTTLDYDEIIKLLALAPIPDFADGCIVDIMEDHQINRIITKHSDPSTEELMFELHRRYPPSVNSPQPSAVVIRTGKPKLLRNVDLSVILDHTLDREHMGLISKIGVRSLITVPIQIRGQTIGAINLLNTTNRRNFDDLDLDMAVELSHRGAVAMENARLYRDAQLAIHQRDDFISIASHELKTPITSLKMQMQVASRSISKSPSPHVDATYVKKIMDTSNTQLDRLTRLVEDMLDISRISTGKMVMSYQEVDFSELVKDVLTRFADQMKELGIDIHASLEEGVNVSCDVFRIEQVITNLLTNAIRYGERRPIHVLVTRQKDRAILKVQDFGLGIAKKDQERVFNRFERAISASDVSGLGLGLFICREIIHAHDGHINIESELGQGTTFTIDLKLLQS